MFHSTSRHPPEHTADSARIYRRGLSLLISTALHSAFVALLVATAWLFEPTPPWRPPRTARVIILRPPNTIYPPRLEHLQAEAKVFSDTLVKEQNPAPPVSPMPDAERLLTPPESMPVMKPELTLRAMSSVGITLSPAPLPSEPLDSESTEEIPLVPDFPIGAALGDLGIVRTPIALPDITNRQSEPDNPPFRTVSRIDHPTNGRFDMIVLQPSLEDILPETAGLMKDKPVYSVYLQVGDTKEWILHYCAAGAEITQQGAVIQLPDPRPVSAPYPRVTFRPTTPLSGQGSYVLISGFIDETGVFRNLRVLSQSRTDLSALLSELERWLFRPASRGPAAASVEIVLAIPVKKT
jgi:hypothetical protein